MKMTADKKLTEAPTNLKEAIDWVLKVKEVSAIEKLAAALGNLLKEEAGDVAVRVKDVYEGICKKFCQNVSHTDWRPASYLKHFLNKLQTFEPVRRSGDETDEKMLERLKGESESLKASLFQLPENLKKFLGATDDGLKTFDGKGIIKKNGASSYTPAYNDAIWNSAEASDCAVILLATSPILYLGLGFLHWRCGKEKTKSGWKESTLKDADTIRLTGYLKGMGFNGVTYSDSTTGENIASHLSSIINHSITYDPSQQPISQFFKDLQNKAFNSSPPSPSSPLTSLYLISYYYISYPLHDVQSSSPANPSFLGYSGPAALAGGAYGFNIGGLGTFVSALLA
ncbi:uncharacterized protein BcabD6B2_48020 [Babesia caballi]|uniref:Uncharacterized protein n=1 Tax=Babesia caballi TaxID=5871 RepID=A0AAV4M0F3_BABCB|nr:hypothetical protein, conserved [Babesia caballi]